MILCDSCCTVLPATSQRERCVCVDEQQWRRGAHLAPGQVGGEGAGEEGPGQPRQQVQDHVEVHQAVAVRLRGARPRAITATIRPQAAGDAPTGDTGITVKRSAGSPPPPMLLSPRWGNTGSTHSCTPPAQASAARRTVASEGAPSPSCIRLWSRHPRLQENCPVQGHERRMQSASVRLQSRSNRNVTGLPEWH